MECVHSETVNINWFGGSPAARRVRAVIIATDDELTSLELTSLELTSLELSGEDVDGLDENDVLAVGSMIISPTKNYIAFEDGVFTEKTTGTSGSSET